MDRENSEVKMEMQTRRAKMSEEAGRAAVFSCCLLYTSRSLFMGGYESGKEAKSREVESLKRKLAQVRFENWENVGWEDKDE